MQIEDLMTDCGLSSAEALGMACLCGMSASHVYSREDFLSKVSIFSTPKPPPVLEEHCGFIGDIKMAMDLGDCLTLLSSGQLTFSVHLGLFL